MTTYTVINTLVLLMAYGSNDLTFRYIQIYCRNVKWGCDLPFARHLFSDFQSYVSFSKSPCRNSGEASSRVKNVYEGLEYFHLERLSEIVVMFGIPDIGF